MIVALRPIGVRAPGVFGNVNRAVADAPLPGDGAGGPGALPLESSLAAPDLLERVQQMPDARDDFTSVAHKEPVRDLHYVVALDEPMAPPAAVPLH